jgi:hypothetical protein
MVQSRIPLNPRPRILFAVAETPSSCRPRGRSRPARTSLIELPAILLGRKGNCDTAVSWMPGITTTGPRIGLSHGSENAYPLGRLEVDPGVPCAQIDEVIAVAATSDGKRIGRRRGE